MPSKLPTLRKDGYEWDLPKVDRRYEKTPSFIHKRNALSGLVKLNNQNGTISQKPRFAVCYQRSVC